MSDDLRGAQDTNEQERPLSEIIDGLVARHGLNAVEAALQRIVDEHNRQVHAAHSDLPETVSPEDMKGAAQGGRYYPTGGNR